MIQKNKKCVLVLSGGMDSTTLLYYLIDKGYEVRTISFDYGQRHRKELEMAMQTCLKLGIKHKVVTLGFMTDLCSNSALTGDIEVPEGHYEDENMKLTVVPNRNMIMASIAIGYAVNIEAGNIALGVHKGDHAIYPDCRKEFIEKLNEVSEIANYQSVEILYPFIDMNKGGIVKEGIRLGVDYSLTWTCYKGKEKACGKCGSCQERLEAFEENGIEDPLEYDN